jgi:hypothetical protein
LSSKLRRDRNRRRQKKTIMIEEEEVNRKLEGRTQKEKVEEVNGKR